MSEHEDYVALPKGNIKKLIGRELTFNNEPVELKIISNMNKITSENKVSHPSHYTWLKELCGIEVIDITRHMDFDLGNAVKYLLRAGHKSEEGYSNIEKTIEDLKKAKWYIDDKIKMLEDGCKSDN